MQIYFDFHPPTTTHMEFNSNFVYPWFQSSSNLSGCVTKIYLECVHISAHIDADMKYYSADADAPDCTAIILDQVIRD